MGEEKSWKKQAEELAEKSRELAEKSERLDEKIERYLESSGPTGKAPSGGDDKNPTGFEELMLENARFQREEHNHLIVQHERVLTWMSEFEWMSKKQTWIAMLASIIATVLGAFLL